jgi:Fe-Mn family superoxide dismutase
MQVSREEADNMSFTLPALPYGEGALAPYLTEETLEYHHGKHHAAYVTNLNNLTVDAGLNDSSLEEVIMTADGGLFNNAAQVWNHSFYWKCMKPGGGGRPKGDLAAAIDAAFGSYDDFAKEFVQAALTQFGSGWAWLVKAGDVLQIVKTGNADLPLKHGQTALLTVDVWEHAYYIDYRNLRQKYVETFLGNLVDWDFVAANHEAAK